MALELEVNGFLNLTISKNGEEVSPEETKEIYEKLENADYVISLSKRVILDLVTFEELYTFELEPTDDLEYEFNLIKN